MNNMTPERERELAVALKRHTDESSDDYDADFTAELRRIRPDWFDESQSNTTSEEGPEEPTHD